MNQIANPWRALSALLIGFFMILMDTTIVAIANPVIQATFDADLSLVIWVTSAYLLAYAAPMLIAGHLGDRFGPRTIYLTGLALFTLASFACGLAGDVSTLIAARVGQGLGAALVTPQTMAIITRIFAPEVRGAAMGLWGSVAGVATLAGPLLGGVLVQTLGWQWIFFVNVPIGIVGFVAAWRLIPRLEKSGRGLDWPGVVLSGAGMFLVVFAIQEGAAYDWGSLIGPITVPILLALGILLMMAFVLWQRWNRAHPLLPLVLFRDRNYSVATTAVFLVGVGATTMPVPLAFFFQDARGLSPTSTALMLVPMAVISGVLGPFVGRLADRVGVRWISVSSLLITSLALFAYAALLTTETPLILLLLPSALLGLGFSGVFAPLASTASRNLPHSHAGSGSGAYSAIRQLGSVLGSAAIAAVMGARLAAEAPAVDAEIRSGALSSTDAAGYATAMAQSLWLPGGAFLCCAMVALFLVRPSRTAAAAFRVSNPVEEEAVKGGRK